MAKLFAHTLLGLVLLTAAASGQLSLAAKKADPSVNVLDLQRVIAQVLAGNPAAAGDVNGDGRVDILDFQALLNQAQHARPAPVNGPRPSERGTMVNARAAGIAIARDLRVKPISPEEGKSASSLGAHPALLMFVASAKTERHLNNLSPNAPPRFG